jgi:putative DNA primase/helicase
VRDPGGRARREGLRDALKAELPGILAWAVAGCRLWQQRASARRARSRDATEAYRVEQDTLGSFLDEYCEIGDGFAASTPPLYEAYKEWAKDGELHPLSKIAFGRQLEERGFIAEKRGTGNQRTTWRLGLRLVRYAAGPAWTPRDQSLFGDRERDHEEELSV